MKIRIRKTARSGSARIPPGDYEVGVDEQSGQITLAGGSAVFKLDALQRPSKARVNKPTAKLRQVVGEPRWLLVARTPPASEWVVSLQDATE
jgi:hypothetical protein